MILLQGAEGTMHRQTRRTALGSPLGIVTALTVLAAPAAGQVKTYSGLDAGATPGAAHPNYDTALAAFQKGTGGPFAVDTFERLPVGPFTNPHAPESPASATFGVGLGVTASLSSVD